jgi:hypothetical protein
LYLKKIGYYKLSLISKIQNWSSTNPLGHLEYYSVLTKIQAFALDAHFTLEQVGRNSKAHFINFNGTAGFEKTCILDAGNWESDTPEDLDLSYRAQLKTGNLNTLNILKLLNFRLLVQHDPNNSVGIKAEPNFSKIARVLQSDTIGFKPKPTVFCTY